MLLYKSFISRSLHFRKGQGQPLGYTFSLEHNHIPTCFVKSFWRYASVSQFSGKSKVDCITRKRGPISLSVSGNFRLPKINLNLTYSPNRVEELNPNQNFVIDFEEKPNYE